MIHPGFNPEEYIAGAAPEKRSAYKKRARKSPRACSQCGLMVKCLTDPALVPWHTRGVWHQHAARIKALLAQECLTFSEIGVRLGITRERVRQIALALNVVPGFERMKTCTLRRYEQKITSSLPEKMPAQLRAKVEALGLNVSGVRRASRATTCRISTRDLLVNGHLCRVKVSAVACRPNDTADYAHFDIRTLDADFYLLHAEWANQTWVVPTSFLRRMSYYIPIGPRNKYTDPTRRDWEQFRESFAQLAATGLSVEG